MIIDKPLGFTSQCTLVAGIFIELHLYVRITDDNMPVEGKVSWTCRMLLATVGVTEEG